MWQDFQKSNYHYHRYSDSDPHNITSLIKYSPCHTYCGITIFRNGIAINGSHAYVISLGSPVWPTTISSPSCICLCPPSDSTMVEKEKVKWSIADDATLIHMLTTVKIRGDWGDNNSKKTIWTECADDLEGSKKKSGGIAKQVNAIISRWGKVRPINSNYMQLYWSMHTAEAGVWHCQGTPRPLWFWVEQQTWYCHHRPWCMGCIYQVMVWWHVHLQSTHICA